MLTICLGHCGGQQTAGGAQQSWHLMQLLAQPIAQQQQQQQHQVLLLRNKLQHSRRCRALLQQGQSLLACLAA
jgi:hypothetical protein